MSISSSIYADHANQKKEEWLAEIVEIFKEIRNADDSGISTDTFSKMHSFEEKLEAFYFSE